MTYLSLPELYETLASGGKFQLAFATKQEAIKFQQSLGGIKHRKEKFLKNVGMVDEHHKFDSLTMEYDSETKIATFALGERKKRAARTFEILTLIPSP